MIARVAMAAPIELAVNGFPFGAITAAPALRHRSARRMSAVMQIVPANRPLGDPVVGSVESVADDHAVDEIVRRHADRAVADDRHRHAVAEGDLVDLLLDRAGVGIDKDADHRAWSCFFFFHAGFLRGGSGACPSLRPSLPRAWR
jgi:hypothetical protein